MNFDVDEKLDVSRVLIQRVEGSQTKATVSSIEAANTVLERWAGAAPEAGYEQCNVQVVFEDGFRIRGHYHLTRSQKRVSLSRHLRKQLTAMAEDKAAKKSVKREDDAALSLSGSDPVAAARQALANYNI